MRDVREFAIKPSFGGLNIKLEEVLCFSSIIEDLFTNRYSKKDKIKVNVIFLKDKVQMWYDILKKDCKGCELGSIRKWKNFKDFFFEKFLPCGFQLQMLSRM